MTRTHLLWLIVGVVILIGVASTFHRTPRQHRNDTHNTSPALVSDSISLETRTRLQQCFDDVIYPHEMAMELFKENPDALAAAQAEGLMPRGSSAEAEQEWFHNEVEPLMTRKCKDAADAWVGECVQKTHNSQRECYSWAELDGTLRSDFRPRVIIVR